MYITVRSLGYVNSALCRAVGINTYMKSLARLQKSQLTRIKNLKGLIHSKGPHTL